MFEYSYGIRVPEKKAEGYRSKLIKTFAQEYNIELNRMWNCLTVKSICVEFEKARLLGIPVDVMVYLERQNEVYRTTFEEVCKYIDELEPWEYVDAYIFDDSFSWLLAITHEELKCMVVGFDSNVIG